MLGNRVLNTYVNAMYRTHYTDRRYGYSALWTGRLPNTRVDCNGLEVETLIDVSIAKAGFVVLADPSHEHLRVHARFHLHAIRDGTRVVNMITVESRPRRRVRRQGRDWCAYTHAGDRPRRMWETKATRNVAVVLVPTHVASALAASTPTRAGRL